MNTINLWGDLPEVGAIRSPESILKEQASELNRMTNGKIMGLVRQPSTNHVFAFDLILRVPSLNNYTVAILRIWHDIGLYPLNIESQIHSTSADFDGVAINEDEFIKKLQAILTDEKTRSILKTLLVHTKSIDS